MKNREIIAAINNINEFASIERESKTAKLPIAAEFTVMENLSMLKSAYDSYALTLDSIRARHTVNIEYQEGTSEEMQSEINELLNTERDGITVKKINKSDFKDGTLLSDMMLLEFMTE